MYRNKSLKSRMFIEFFELTAGAVIMGVALSIFFVPFKIAPGGVSGLSTILHYITKIKTGILIVIINLPIFLLGLIFFDFKFLLRSLYGTLALSVSVDALERFLLPINDIVLACAFGGVIMGIGVSVVLKSGGTTGGTDVVVLVIKRFFPNLSVGQLFLIIDGLIVVLAGIVFKSWETMLYSAASIYISSNVTDAVLEGLHYARIAYIMSDRETEITEQIYSELNRGVTALNSVSMFNGRDKKVLLCAIRKYEVTRLKRIVNLIDENAFVIITEATEIMGKGFENNIV